MKKTWCANFFILLFCSSIYCFGQTSPEGEKYFNTALGFLQKKEYQKAIDNFTLSLKYIPTGENIYFLRGQARYEQGNYSSAIVDFNMAISLRKEVADFYNARAWTRCFTGDFVNATIDADKAITLEKKGEFYDTRATAYGLRLSFYNALYDFNDAIKSDPKPLYYYKRGLIKKANNDLTGAAQDFSQARKLDPTESFKKNKDPFFTFFTEHYFAKKNKTPTTTTTIQKTFIYPVKQDQFSILFPKLPEEKTSSNASFSKNFTASCDIGSETYFFHYVIVSLNKYENLKNTDLLKNIREQYAKALNATISNIRSLTYKYLYSGVSYQLKMPGRYGLFKEIRADNKIYRIGLFNSSRYPTNDELEFFFNGFNLAY